MLLRFNVLHLGKKRSLKRVLEIAPDTIGVYVIWFHGKAKYVGRAIGKKRHHGSSGLKKRLLEHWSGSSNAKREVYKHRSKVKVQLITCMTVHKAKRVEAKLIRKYDTVRNGWNRRYED